MKDRRRTDRLIVDNNKINGKMLFSNMLIIRDISIDGISFKTDKRVNIGSEYTLKIEDKEKKITVKGIIVWSQLNESKIDIKGNVVPIYTIGMKFNINNNEVQNEIWQLVEKYKKDLNKNVNVNEIGQPSDNNGNFLESANI